MTRTLTSVVTAAVGQDVTTPVYLILMNWNTPKRIATWDTNISWNAQTWTASGASVDNLSEEGGTLTLPNGDGDVWLALLTSDVALDRTVQIWEHHTSTASPAGSDAELVFSGRMDSVSISGISIRINLVEGRTNKGFPATSIGKPNYTWLLPVGEKLYWGNDVITVN